jgi:hypothetical protein
VPLRIVIAETRLRYREMSFDNPAGLFAVYGNGKPELDPVSRELTATLAGVLSLLGPDVQWQLASAS